MFERGGGFVDLTDLEALGDHRVEVESAVLGPGEEHRKVAVWSAAAADRADVLLLVDQQTHHLLLSKLGPGLMRHAHQNSSTAARGAENARADGAQDLLHGDLAADAVEGEVDAGDWLAEASRDTSGPGGQLFDLLDRVALTRVDAVSRAEPLGELKLFLVEIDRNDRIGLDY